MIRYLVAAALLAAPVASAAAQDSVQTVTKDAPAKRDRNVITAEDLAPPQRQAQTVYEAIRSLRPNFLSVRGTQSCLTGADMGGCNSKDKESGRVHASIDGTTVVSVEELKNLRASVVTEIRFLPPPQAMQRFGGNALQGPVILVKTM